ncbi:MAG: phosphate ABC transporter substrate-binding/OmpA family protein [Thermoanaerobaculales bacterium]|jgi:NitT/TauT family transport system substrate-binding protein|nr:phosphate ABC transporter substrate-binding/OmpA family protein [Thermoanaerobaculales bacterium]
MADNVGPTKLGRIVIVLFVLALLAGAAYFLRDLLAPSGSGPGDVDLDAFRQQQGKVEAPDTAGITTVNEYTYVPAERLPPVKGVSAYSWDAASPVVEFPINVWIGWLPIVAANHGFRPNEESIFFKEYGFKVNLKLIDDPVVARDAFAAGSSHILWGTLDMMALFAPDLMKDSRTAPRIFQQVDWSAGGDGIVVRGDIASARDLKGKTIVYAQNSPSQYFINNLLLNAGIQPGEVTHRYTATAFEAAAAFVSDRSIDACVSWAPDIYNIPEKVEGTRILTTTAEASKLIADVWAARADFAKDHPEIVKGLVAGIFKAMDLLKDDTFKGQAFQWMAEGYGMGVDEVQGMAADAHSTNFAENKDFFLNQNNPANFERTWKNITFVYRELGLIATPVRFDEVMDFSVLQQLDREGVFSHQRDEYTTQFVPTTYSRVQAEAPILTQTIRINFFPNSSNIFEPEHDAAGNAIKGTLYDPTAEATLEKVARLAGQYERAVIAVVGHTDSSMQGRGVRFEDVEKLSLDRANAVKQALVEKYKFDPDKFVVEGMGWNQPADPDDPANHALNRRVEISVYPPEVQ